MNKKELWLKLSSYHFENLVSPDLFDHISETFGGTNASTKAFALKICRKHGWNKQFALTALSEYKKFVFLGIVSDFHVTPSKIIDVVWHEHILFSKAYRDFCNDIIEYQFDHFPELIPMTDETGRYNAQYMDTLELYKNEFGIEAPTAIWSVAKHDTDQIDSKDFASRKKNDDSSSNGGSAFANDAPLHSNFQGNGNELELNQGYNGEMDGDSGFDGGGASSSWFDSDSSDSSSDGGGCSGGCGGGD